MNNKDNEIFYTEDLNKFITKGEKFEVPKKENTNTPNLEDKLDEIIFLLKTLTNTISNIEK